MPRGKNRPPEQRLAAFDQHLTRLATQPDTPARATQRAAILAQRTAYLTRQHQAQQRQRRHLDRLSAEALPYDVHAPMVGEIMRDIGLTTTLQAMRLRLVVDSHPAIRDWFRQILGPASLSETDAADVP